MKKPFITALGIITILLGLSTRTVAQANDSCANAISIVTGVTCVYDTFSSVGATAEGVAIAPNPTCGFYQGGDVWFTTVVPASGNIRFQIYGMSGYNAQWAVYTGTCGSMSQYLCSQLNGDKTVTDTSLAGQTVYIRVYGYNTANGGSFRLCFFEPDPPINNNCADAIMLPVGNTCSMDTFTNAYATGEATSVAPNPTCGFYQGSDVWFKFVMPASGIVRIEKTTNYAQTTIYSGSCGNFTQIACLQLNNEKTIVDTSLAGDTLYLRTYSYSSEDGGQFSICLWEPTLPVNNDCANAIALPVGNVCSMDTFTNDYATPEDVSVAPNPTCGFYQGSDVWFTFVWPTSGNLRIEKTTNYAQTAFYTGTCGNFTQIACLQLNNEKTFVDTSLAGQTVYIRAYAYSNEDGGQFSICLWEPPIPVNNNCADAILLPVGNTCTLDTFTNDYATPEDVSVAPNPTCGFYQGSDVWFKFVWPASGNLRIEKTTNYAQTAFYTGTCGNFNQIACLQLNNEKTFVDTSLAGDTVYIRAFAYSNEDGGQFSICLWDPPVPSNDNCDAAIALPVGTTCSPDTFSNAYATSQASVAPNPGCGFYQGGDVWFTVTVPQTGNLLIERRNISGVNAQFALYEGVCDSMSVIDCAQLRSSMYLSDTSYANQTLYLRVFNYNSEEGGTFSLCAYDTTCNLINNFQIRDTICFGDTLAFGSLLLTAPGNYAQIFAAGNLCDSVVNLQLYVHPSSLANVYKTLCPGDNYVFPSGDTVFDIQTAFNDTSILVSSTQCDSFVITHINLFNSYLLYDTVNVCSGDDHTFPDGDMATNITSTLTDTSMLMTADMCDSTIITTITVTSIFVIRDTARVCPGGDHIFPDGDTLFNIYAATVDTSILPSITACDSMVITQLYLYPAYLFVDTVHVCYGDSYTFPDGSTIANIIDTLHQNSVLQTGLGCDSAIVTIIRVNPTYQAFDTATLCPGSSYTFPDGHTQNFIGLPFTDTSVLASALSCDSVIYTTIQLYNGYLIYDSAFICPGGSVTFPDGTTTNNITSDLTQTSMLSTVQGCDSIIQTRVHVLLTYLLYDTVGVCPGDDYTFPDGDMATNVMSTVTDTSMLQTGAGCDSTIITTLEPTTLDTTVTQTNETLTVNSTTGATYQWIDCANNSPIAGATGASYTATANGSYAVVISYNGCADTSGCHTVTGVGLQELQMSDIKVYPNPTKGTFSIDLDRPAADLSITVTNLLGEVVYQTEASGLLNIPVSISTAPGIYFLQLNQGTGTLSVKVVKY